MQRELLIGLALAGLVAGSCKADDATPPFKVKLTEDVRYWDGADERHDRQVLDVIRPEGQTGRPVVVIVHGGSWMFGDKNLFGLYRNVGKQFAQQGVVAVMVNYALAPGTKFPGNVKDVARAIAWVRRNIKNHGGNPDHIVLCGHSAGGHLVSLVTADPSYLKARELKLTDADRAAVRGVVSVSGVYRIPDGELLPKLIERWAEGMGPSARDNRRLTSGFNPFKLAFGEDPAVCRKASPVTHVHAAMPPFLILYAQQDLPLLPQMAEEFHKELGKARVKSTIEKVKDRTHNSILFDARKPDDVVARKIRAFIDETKPARGN